MKRIPKTFQHFSGKNSGVNKNVFLRYTFRQDKIFIICSNNGEFLFDSHNVIIPANLCLAPVTECLAS